MLLLLKVLFSCLKSRLILIVSYFNCYFYYFKHNCFILCLIISISEIFADFFFFCGWWRDVSAHSYSIFVTSKCKFSFLCIYLWGFLQVWIEGEFLWKFMFVATRFIVFLPPGTTLKQIFGWRFSRPPRHYEFGLEVLCEG